MLHSLDKLVDLVAARGADAVASGHERETERERERREEGRLCRRQCP